PVVGEPGEASGVLPYPVVRCVEDMRAAAVDLDTGGGVGRAAGGAADVVATVQNEDPQTQLDGAAFGDGETEQSGTHDHEVDVHSPHPCPVGWSVRRPTPLPPATVRCRRAPSGSAPAATRWCLRQPTTPSRRPLRE